MSHHVYFITIPVTVVVLTHKLRHLARSPKDPAQWSMCVMTATMGSAAALGTPEVYIAFDTTSGIPNLARLILHLLAIFGMAAGHVFILNLNNPSTAARKATIRFSVLSPLVVVMVAAFFAAPRDVEAPVDFVEQYANSPGMGIYQTIYLAILALGVGHLMVFSLHYGQHTTSALVRLGSRLMSGGAVAGVCYLVNKSFAFSSLRYETKFLFDISTYETFARVSVAAGIVPVLLGITIPALGPRLITLSRWPRRRRTYKALHSLWLDIYRTAPQVGFSPPRKPEKNRAPGPFTVRSALLRRIVEIRDGSFELRPYLNSTITSMAEETAREHGLTGAHLRASVEAARIAAVVKTAQRSPGAPQSRGAVGDTPLSKLGAEDVDADAAALAPVAEAYSKSPIVTRITRELAGKPTDA